MKEAGDDLPKDPKICFMGNYPPKECGIATFTKDLVTSMNKKFNPVLRSRVIALNDEDTHYNYDNKVILEMNREGEVNYAKMAETINNSPDHKLVCVQHEFGIFGGDYGKHLLPFLEKVKKPIAITFHSVLPDPDPERKRIVKQIAANVSAIIVMAKSGVEILNRDYGIEKSKIYVIHHGTPNAPFIGSEKYKKNLNIPEDKLVILTFGLLSVNKGIEYIIKSLPPLVKNNPNILYLVLGETHPNIRKREGEVYRNSLLQLVKGLGLEKNVKFIDKYVTTKDLVKYILASDIVAFTNLERVQITSGTLAYAVACGRPVVATPVIYAEEILKQDRGIVIDSFRNPEAYTKALRPLIEDEVMRKNMAEAAYAFGRQMIWANVAKRHLNVFNRIVKLREETTKKYPRMKMDHVQKLTDPKGMIQFAKGSTPDKKSGYTVDDNARALIASIIHSKITHSRVSKELIPIYLKFLESAQEKNGQFKNNHNNKNEFTDTYSEDALGRVIWALGLTCYKSNNPEIIELANKIFKKSRPRIEEMENVRAKSFAITGLYYHYKKYKDKTDLKIIKKLANSIVKLYKIHATNDWNWFEDFLTYSNAKIPMSLFYAYIVTKNEKYLEVAENTLHFLSDITFVEDILHPIGQNGWFKKNGKRSYFDQQPIDAAAMVLAYLAAYKATKDDHYMEKASLAFNWFLGQNHLKQMLYDEGTGGCFDGLGKYSLNLNQGAESTMAYLISRVMLEEKKRRAR